MKIQNVSIFPGPGLRLMFKRVASGTVWVAPTDAKTDELRSPVAIFPNDADMADGGATIERAVSAFNAVMDAAANGEGSNVET